jgi:hypothetical protein
MMASLGVEINAIAPDLFNNPPDDVKAQLGDDGEVMESRNNNENQFVLLAGDTQKRDPATSMLHLEVTF